MKTIYRFSTVPEATAFLHGVRMIDDPLITAATGPRPADITVTDHGADEDTADLEDLVDHRDDPNDPIWTLHADRSPLSFIRPEFLL